MFSLVYLVLLIPVSIGRKCCETANTLLLFLDVSIPLLVTRHPISWMKPNMHKQFSIGIHLDDLQFFLILKMLQRLIHRYLCMSLIISLASYPIFNGDKESNGTLSLLSLVLVYQLSSTK